MVKADEDGCITDLNGNKLRLNPAWTNPSGAGQQLAVVWWFSRLPLREGGVAVHLPCLVASLSKHSETHQAAHPVPADCSRIPAAPLCCRPRVPAAAARAGEWHVGAKAAYELFPGGLKSRLQAGCCWVLIVAAALCSCPWLCSHDELVAATSLV